MQLFHRSIRLRFVLVLVTMVFGVLVLVPSTSQANDHLPEGARTASHGNAPVSSMATTSTVLFMPFVTNNFSPPIPSVFGAQVLDALDSASAGLNQAQLAHLYWVRWPVSWSDIEPTNTTPDQYNWSALDNAVKAAGRAGIKLVVTINWNPSWAATYLNGPIDKVSVSEFAQFAGALAGRYNGATADLPAVDYWEFYNEPDAGSQLNAEYGASYWGPFGSQYAQMLCAVYPAIKAANPSAKVAMGGLAYDNFSDDTGGPFVRSFLDDVLNAGGGSCFDAMNFHYYPFFAPKWAAYGPGLLGKANYVRSKLQAHGIGSKPMIVTEAGWHSDAYSDIPSTPETQSRYVVKLFAEALAARLDLMAWYTWKDIGPSAAANGLVTNSLQPKTSFTTFRVAAEKLNWGAATFQRALTATELGSSAFEGYLFLKPGSKFLYVLWSNDSTTQNVTLPLSQARVTDLYGNLVTTVSGNGQVSVSVGPNPIYAETP